MIEFVACLVIAVSDGDTIKLRCGQAGDYGQHTIRISAIDAPEKGQAFGQRAKEALSDLCFKQVATVKPVTTDRYKRTVADVQCRGKDVGEYMVSTGHAWVYDKYAKGYGSLYPLQDSAKTNRRGLWADLATKVPPVAPWEWRKAQREG